MSERLSNTVRTLLAWMLGALFIYAGVEKIMDPAQFAQSIKYFKILPLSYINAVAIILPWWEVAAGFAILTRAWRPVGAWLILLMLIVFTIAIASAVSRGLDISCGCFGKSSGKAGYSKLAENFCMIAAAGMVLWLKPRETPGEPAIAEIPQPAA